MLVGVLQVLLTSFNPQQLDNNVAGPTHIFTNLFKSVPRNGY